MKSIVVSLVALVVFLLMAELGLRGIYVIRASMIERLTLPYMYGDLYGPLPPWWDNLRMLEADETLIWKGRPNVRRTYIDVFSPVSTEEDRRVQLRAFFPSLPDSLRNNPAWQISLDSEGFRDQEFVDQKTSSAFRIVCLGDSWTFGANVGQDQAYPQQLQRLLRQGFPQANFQVLNMGVLGYSSFQGLELLRKQAITLNPDLVLIGFGMNDGTVAGYRDKDLPASLNAPSWSRSATNALEHSELYKLLRYAALRVREQRKSLSDVLQSTADSARKHGDLHERAMMEEAVYEKVEGWTRVSLKDYEANIAAMIQLARSRGAGVALLFNELWQSSPYVTVLRKIARSEDVPLIDSSAIVAAAQRKIEEHVEAELNLKPLALALRRSHHDVEVVFRARGGKQPVPKTIYISGTHPSLGDRVPNKIAMYDDGTHGDQLARDHVWSYAATFSPGTSGFYVYTNSGREGEWEGLDVPHVRGFKVDAADAGKTIYRPIETFGEIYLQADSWHTNALGYELIAQAVLQYVKRDEKVKAYLERFKVERRDAAMPASKTVPGHRL